MCRCAAAIGYFPNVMFKPAKIVNPVPPSRVATPAKIDDCRSRRPIPSRRQRSTITGLSPQLPALLLFIILIASSIVKVFGFWMIGNSLNVAANLSAIV